MKTRTEQDYRRRIASVVEAILLDPAAPHTVRSLAESAHFSPFHFHRLYCGITGESPGETVRRLRLAHAAGRLAAGDGDVTDIAFSAGYESPQSFARAFRAAAGISPTGFQDRQHRFSGITFVEQPAMIVSCLPHQGTVATIPHTYSRLRRWAGQRDGAQIGLISLGPDSWSYAAGMLSAPLPETGLVERRSLPGGRYAVCRLQGSYALIDCTIGSLLRRWLPASGLDLDRRPLLELYRDRPGSVAVTDQTTDLLIPVR